MIEERIKRYYERMTPELRLQWDRLSPSQQKAVFEPLVRFHEVLETATWDFTANIIKAILQAK